MEPVRFLGMLLILLAIVPGGAFLHTLRKDANGVRVEKADFSVLLLTVIMLALGGWLLLG